VEVKLNIGCGEAWQKQGWLGINLSSTARICQPSNGAHPIDLDIRKGLPFASNSVDVIFASHALAQFTHDEVIVVLVEMYRVLKIGAPLCLAMPDMEKYDFPHMLRIVGFDKVELTGLHEFPYWTELREIEGSPLSLQCRKLTFNPDYKNHAALVDAKRSGETSANSGLERHLKNLESDVRELQQQIREGSPRTHNSVRRAKIDARASLKKRFQELRQTNRLTQDALDTALAKLELMAERLHQWPNRDRELRLLQRQLQKRGKREGGSGSRIDRAMAVLRPARARETQRLLFSTLFDNAWYVARNSGVSPETALEHYLNNGLRLDPGPLFDTKWYLGQNPQIEAFGENPLAHYLEFWATEGGDPHPLFDTNWYLKKYPDVAQANVPPLRHYVEWGAAEGRDPNPLFDSDWYLRKYADVAAAGINPLAHYISHGAAEGRSPHPLFNGSWYIKTYPDVAKGGLNPLTHYLLYGAAERRDPHPLFQSRWYVREYPQATSKRANALAEYLEEGAAEGRNPNPYFDSEWYLETYPDVDPQAWNPLAHYVEAGEAEGRDPSPLFKPSLYLKANPDVADQGDSPLAHFLHYGQREGRNPYPAAANAQEQALRIALQRSGAGPYVPSETLYSPLMSILLPTYNTPARYLQDAIQSVRRQTYPHWELCVVDDGSQDQACLEYLRRTAQEDPRIRVSYSAYNCGIAESSQQALLSAQGEFIAFLDHDDVLAPHALAEVVGVLREHPNVGMIYTDHAMMDEDGTLRSASLKPGWSQEFFLSTNYIVHFKVIRRTVAAEVDGFRDTLDSAQDVGFTCKIAGSGFQVLHLPKVLYYWRVHPSSVASGSSAKPAIETAAIQTYNDFLAKQSVPAAVVWPDYFRTRRIGAYKLEFPNTSDRKVAIVLPGMLRAFDSLAFQIHFPKTDFAPLPPVHLISRDDRQLPGLQCHQAEDQETFDRIVSQIECDYLVFLSPSSKLLSTAWLRELVGYFAVSPAIGAVGGKILDSSLRVKSGGLLLLNQVTPISRGEHDESPGYWFNNLLASNVEAVSASLLATPKALYTQLGGIPFFQFGDAAGVPYCLNLRNAGYRVVYTPWSKVIDPGPEITPTNLAAMLETNFGPASKTDRYYHPFFSKDVPYQMEGLPAGTVLG
jgi:glycosyltransferase involved in cell wall biosynthesis